MTELKPPRTPISDWQRVRDEWICAVDSLVTDVAAWCKANDWPCRRIEKTILESKIGEYVVPALLIQVDLVKLMLEPVARFVPECEGLVHLYSMPEYDEVVRLYFKNGIWFARFQLVGEKIPNEVRRSNPGIQAMTEEDVLDPATFARTVESLK